MSKQDPIGHAECPHCGKKVAITPTENYWYHTPAKGYTCATRGQFRIYCTGSGEPISAGERQRIRAHQTAARRYNV